ncbi:YjjG family noncanonical pyrimidine nucleotidase [Companilactobacillus jidongensis]|uniref:YjjG family noncanonical pyrimidine nucleotidase n=1 Tax=Companilactobacillus jidongensis TaxID=2486006 RepID=UPI000F793803|nr:YjjG family noncanonical pyrimidine nucleotidase [Companilactobacillus jidongensis]
MYKYVIFDLDDTLFDFHRGEVEGVRKLMKQEGVQHVDQGLQIYLSINKHVWEQIELGEPSQKLLDTRFALAFSKLGITVDGKELELQYREILNHNFYTINGAEQLLQDLKSVGTTLIVGTNGVKKTQLDRLDGSHLGQYFDDYFISDDIGFTKPDKRFFRPIFKRYPTITNKNTIMVGDNLNSDILGAKRVGLKNIWFNPQRNINSLDFKPTYEVQTYQQVENIIKSN